MVITVEAKLTSKSAQTAWTTTRTVLEGVAAGNDVLNSAQGCLDCPRGALNADLHRVHLLVDLDVHREGLLQKLDGLAALTDHSPDHVLRAIHHLLDASPILQKHKILFKGRELPAANTDDRDHANLHRCNWRATQFDKLVRTSRKLLHFLFSQPKFWQHYSSGNGLLKLLP